MKFLIDECLSPRLAEQAHQGGHPLSSHVVYRGLGGVKDWDLMTILVDEEWTLVTRNSVDFRGPEENPGSDGHYQDVELHAGLVCFNAGSLDLATQKLMFAHALEEIAQNGELINQVLEITQDEGDELTFHLCRYDLPHR